MMEKIILTIVSDERRMEERGERRGVSVIDDDLLLVAMGERKNEREEGQKRESLQSTVERESRLERNKAPIPNEENKFLCIRSHIASLM